MAIEHFITTTLNISDERIKNIQVPKINGVFHIQVTLNQEEEFCPYCGGPIKIKEYKVRTYNHLPITATPSVIDWRRRRYMCKDCGKTFSEHNPFGPETFLQTYAVLDCIAKDLHNIHYTYKDIAERYRVSIPLVQLYADSFIVAPRLTLPTNLGIDELRSDMAKYGGKYLCAFVDNEKRVLSEILPDRSKHTLSKYLEAIPKSERDKVRYVTIDMWLPYRDVAYKYFKNCEVAVDPFHVVKNLSEGFTRIRVDYMYQATFHSPAYYLLKKWHKLLESDYNLDNAPKYNLFFKRKLNYRDIYDMLLNINPNLKIAYELKEEYRLFNKECSYEDAPQRLDELIQKFEQSNLYCYAEFVGLLKNWRTEIINSFKRPLENRKQSNSLAESLNEKLRELIHVSHGYSNFDRFRARALYCLNDSLFYSLTNRLSTNKRVGKKRGKYNKPKPLIQNEEDPFFNDGPDSDNE